MKELSRILFCMLLLVSCRPNIPPIAFKVDKVESLPSFPNDKKDSFINLRLSTEEDFLKIYKEEKAANIYLYCPLTLQGFSADNIGKETRRLNGFFPYETRGTSLLINNRYLYNLRVSFENGQARPLPKDTVLNLLKNKDCIECEVVMAFYLKQGYFSDSFCIPVDSIVRYVK